MTTEKSDLEITLDTSVEDFLRVLDKIPSRVMGFLTVIYGAKVVNTMYDVTSLRDEQVYMVDNFGEKSYRSLNKLLRKYSLPTLKTDLGKRELSVNRRLADLETVKVTDMLGLERGYRMSTIHHFIYRPKKFYYGIVLR